jgi:hypothetical protein
MCIVPSCRFYLVHCTNFQLPVKSLVEIINKSHGNRRFKKDKKKPHTVLYISEASTGDTIHMTIGKLLFEYFITKKSSEY